MNNITNFLDYNFDLRQRLVILNSDITDKSVANISKIFFILLSKSYDPIHFLIQSRGGDVEGCFALYDLMHTIPCPIYTYANGMCQSSAVLLLAAGTKGHRFSTSNCYFMMHDTIVDDNSGTLKNIKNTVEFLNELDETFLKLLSENSRLSVKEWRDIYNNVGDKYFNATLAMEYGIIDAIITTQFDIFGRGK